MEKKGVGRSWMELSSLPFLPSTLDPTNDDIPLFHLASFEKGSRKYQPRSSRWLVTAKGQGMGSRIIIGPVLPLIFISRMGDDDSFRIFFSFSLRFFPLIFLGPTSRPRVLEYDFDFENKYI